MIGYFRLLIINLICLREVLANLVNERTDASPVIPMAVFKLQLMCRKQSSIVKEKDSLVFWKEKIRLLGSFTIKSSDQS